MIVYLLTFPSGKAYIGQTVQMLCTRVTNHLAAANNGSLHPVHCAWRKYGEPEATVLGEYASREQLNEAEVAFIQQYGTLAPSGYNVRDGGNAAPSKSSVARDKIREKATGRRATSETKQLVGEASRRHWLDPDYRAKVDAGVRASWTAERRSAAAERTRERNTGRKHSAETIAKMRSKEVSPETRLKMSLAAKARKRTPRSEETKQRIAAATAASWQKPEIAQRRANAIRAGHAANKAK